jgi:hypothetical protein
MGHTQEAERSIHFSSEMVALPASTRASLATRRRREDAKKPFVEVSAARDSG